MSIRILLTLISIPAGLIAQSGEPEVFPQLGHSVYVYKVALTPDGKSVLSSSADETLKLWDVASGREIRTFTGHSGAVYALAMSPDGRTALSGGDDKTIRLWDLRTGRELRRFLGHSRIVWAVAFSADGRYVLSGGEDMRLWDVETGRELRTFVGHAKAVTSVCFSPDGRRAFSASLDGTVKLWDVLTGVELKSFSDHGSGIHSAAWSIDGRQVVSAGSDGTVKLRDLNSSTGWRTLDTQGGPLVSVALSRDGRMAASGNEGGTIKLWDVETGRAVRTIVGSRASVLSIYFSADGGQVLSGSLDGIVTLWSTDTGKLVRLFSGLTTTGRSVSSLPGSRSVFSGCDELALWDLVGVRRILAAAGHGCPVAVSPDGRRVLAAFRADQKAAGLEDLTAPMALGLWETQTGRQERVLSGHDSRVFALAVAPDGRTALSGDHNRVMKLWDLETGKEIWARTCQRSIDSAAFSPDGQTVAVGGFGVGLWDVRSATEIRTILEPTRMGINALAFSPDGKTLLIGDERALELRDVATARQVRVFPGRHSHVVSVGFSGDGLTIASAGGDNTVELWEVATGRLLFTLTHDQPVSAVSFCSWDRHYLVSASMDHSIRLWSLESGKEILKLTSFSDGGWIAITPEGYYNASATGDAHLNVRMGEHVFGIDQWRATFFKPQVLEAAVRLGDTQRAVSEVLGNARGTLAGAMTEPPFVVIRSPDDGAKLGGRETLLSLYVEDRKQPVRAVKVFVNGRPVSTEGDRERRISPVPGGATATGGGASRELKLPVRLDAGQNLIEVTAHNGSAEGRASIRVTAGGSSESPENLRPNLWILAIGINRYNDQKIQSLSYGVADARAIIDVFARQKGRLFRDVNTLLIADDAPIRPTRDNIVDNLSFLSKAGQHDVALLFISGHGVNDDRGEYYFLPSDALIQEDGAFRKSRAVSWRDLKALLDIPARKLMLLDTCHSEGVSGKQSETLRGVDNDRLVKELQDFGAVVFTSSRGREFSTESSKWGHGAFTHAIIRGLEGEAALLSRDVISMKELDTYVSETVPRLTNGAQHPITYTPEGYVNFPIAVLK